MRRSNILIISSILFFLSGLIQAQEVVNDFETRLAVKLGYKPIKNLKLSISPELRLDETFSVGKYHIEADASYKFLEVVSIGATYRFVVNPRETKETEYLSRYSIYTTLKKRYGDFSPSFRLAYSNYADDNLTSDNYWRYKMALKYDIPDNKFTPMIAVEAFRSISLGEMYKMRYTAGGEYEFINNHYVGLKYKLDYYHSENINKHIFCLDYKIKF